MQPSHRCGIIVPIFMLTQSCHRLKRSVAHKKPPPRGGFLFFAIGEMQMQAFSCLAQMLGVSHTLVSVALIITT